jgi:NAD(P)-dependent dehydrogenase (short-subunit alcohol dehydrogenase family)
MLIPGIEGDSARVQDCSEDTWDKTIGVGLKGVWLCMKYESLK